MEISDMLISALHYSFPWEDSDFLLVKYLLKCNPGMKFWVSYSTGDLLEETRCFQMR